MATIDSQILSDRARAEKAARIAQSGEGINPDYVSLTVDQDPEDYVDGTGVPYGQKPVTGDLIQRLFWDTEDDASGWQNLGDPIPTKDYIDDKASLLVEKNSDAVLKTLLLTGKLTLQYGDEITTDGIYIQNQQTDAEADGYPIHLTQTVDCTTANFGIGVDGNGVGIFIANKLGGRGLFINNQDTTNSAQSYAVNITQASNTAPAVYIAVTGSKGAYHANAGATIADTVEMVKLLQDGAERWKVIASGNQIIKHKTATAGLIIDKQDTDGSELLKLRNQGADVFIAQTDKLRSMTNIEFDNEKGLQLKDAVGTGRLAIYLDASNNLIYRNVGGVRHDFRNQDNSTIATISDDGTLRITKELHIPDGIAAPSATAGRAKLYVDTTDGDLKIIFGDGTVKTITTDT